MLSKVSEKLKSIYKNALIEFKRGHTFYMAIAIVLLGITFFSFVCGSSVSGDAMSKENKELSSKVNTLTEEKNTQSNIIKEKEEEIEGLEGTVEELENDYQAEVDSNNKHNEENDAKLDEFMESVQDKLNVDSNSRSGSQLYDQIDDIKYVEYMLRSTIGENDKTVEYLETLAQIRSEAEAKVSYYPDYSPLEYGKLTSRFGYRNDPNGQGVKYHSGVDVWNNAGTPIYAAGAGTVVAAQNMGDYGLCVIIDHGYGYETVYAHCSALLVSAGETVEKGQLIARIGATGNATGNHLHLEIRLDGENQNPLNYVFPQFS